MATEIYKVQKIYTINDVEITIEPLKIKYLKKFMDAFFVIEPDLDQDETLNVLSECVRICMEQLYPKLSKSVEDVQDNFDIGTIYDILYYAAGIKMNGRGDDEEVVKPENPNSENTWENLDLAKLETEVFLVGIWKNYSELEESICLAELMAILSTRRELTYEERKFLAAIQGVDLDAETGNGEVKGQQEWENLKARVYSGGATNDSRDILALQGQNARSAGFGIGLGLSYDDDRDPSVLL